MRYILFSFAASFFICLASCSAIIKDNAEIEKIADDVIEEIIEDAAK